MGRGGGARPWSGRGRRGVERGGRVGVAWAWAWPRDRGGAWPLGRWAADLEGPGGAETQAERAPGREPLAGLCPDGGGGGRTRRPGPGPLRS